MNRRLAKSLTLAALATGAALCVLAVTVAPARLLVHLDNDYLRISVTPRLNFLAGRTLERLKDGASVAFVGQLTIVPDPNSLVTAARSVARFALSYDIWEQKFAVTKMGERADSRHSKSNLSSAEATENWCLENLTIERSMIPSDRPFYVQLDLRAEDPRDQAGIVGESGISISGVVDLFRNPVKSGQKPLRVTNGPLRLADLRKAGHG